MTMLPRFRRLFRVDRGTVDVPVAVADELQFHFDMTIDELVATGMDRDAATREAHRRFGNLEHTRHDLQTIDRARVTHARRAQWWSGLTQDCRYALRGLRRSPGFTLGVMLTLGLGVGANATMFSVIDPLLFRSPDFLAHPERTHQLYIAEQNQGREYHRSSFSYRQYQDFLANTKSFEQIVGYWTPRMAIGTDDVTERMVTGVTASFWKQFPAALPLGRAFGPAEDRAPNGEPVVVLSWPYWQSQLGGRPDVIGIHLRIGRFEYTVIGVAPRGLRGFSLNPTVGFIPIISMAANIFENRGAGAGYHETYSFNWMRLSAERKVGISEATATADFQNAVIRSFQLRQAAEPDSRSVEERRPRAELGPVQAEAGPNRGTDTRVAIWLAGVALLVLIIACANVGNLLLARALRRRREIALRLALGVTRSRLLAQLLTESLLLAALGAACGLFFATFGGAVLRQSLRPDAETSVLLADGRTLTFAAATMLIVALLCGLAPATQVWRADLANSLKSGNREGNYHRSRSRVTLLVVQGALSVLLLVGAGLFVNSLRRVRAQPLGYDADRVSYLEFTARGTPLTPALHEQLQARLLTAAQGVPGVIAASRTVTVPFHTDWSENLFVPGIDSVAKLGDFVMNLVTADYFKTMGTRIVRGRGINATDRAGSERTIVVSESMARILWPGKDAIGQCVKVRADTMPCQNVVGIAEDIKRGSLRDEPGLMFYLPLDQLPVFTSGFYVRTAMPATMAGEIVRRALQPEMPGMSYLTATPLADLVAPEMRSWQLGATMFTIFGGLALVVASIGLYSVVAYTVAQRRQEMGIRVALGATARSVLQLVVGDAVRMMALAVTCGLAASLIAARWIAPLLFHTSPRDPVILAGVAVTLLIVGVAASLVPAWRAATVDPMTALRSE